eukprot:TRINITY_DN2791_c0_g1_i3.p1 TRINITY_DN2791_c0_g1~~TRINITY_DN2791_c0_g1_i3.p1  ORF type:complete len:175 (+),score=78.03 TRINITY_DN2791_c0_g1_i3:114-638(+)
MLRSLVGSEMCIRDRLAAQAGRNLDHAKEDTGTMAAKTAALEQELVEATKMGAGGEEVVGIKERLEAKLEEAEHGLSLEKDAHAEVEQAKAAKKAVTEEAARANKGLAGEQTVVAQIRELQQEVRAQVFKIKALQLQKRLALEDKLRFKTESEMEDRVQTAMRDVGLDPVGGLW